MFQIYNMVSEIHDNVDLVLRMNIIVELREISMRYLTCEFLNRAVLIFSVHKEMIKPNERRHVKVEAPFLDVISGLSIIKLLALDTYDTLTMKVNLREIKHF